MFQVSSVAIQANNANHIMLLCCDASQVVHAYMCYGVIADGDFTSNICTYIYICTNICIYIYIYIYISQ